MRSNTLTRVSNNPGAVQRSFATVEELRWALLEFKNLYNHHWILEGYGYRTPAQARQEKLAQVAEAA